MDKTPPKVEVDLPRNNSYYDADVPLLGTLSDKNLIEYSVSISGDDVVTIIEEGNQNRESYPFGVLSDLPEGKYTLTAKAVDAGENRTRTDVAFIVDRTVPRVVLETPKEGEYYGSTKNIVNITGSIVEKNLEVYSLSYGSGDNPRAWSRLSNGVTIPGDPRLFTWKVGKHDGVPDGVYTCVDAASPENQVFAEFFLEFE